MLIRCTNCGRIIDLRTREVILYYLEGGTIKCKGCGTEIREEGEK